MNKCEIQKKEYELILYHAKLYHHLLSTRVKVLT